MQWYLIVSTVVESLIVCFPISYLCMFPIFYECFKGTYKVKFKN